mmetsp:Transcript_73329/g.227406  ORF Transcript_73329/g.227406 Transcript_73329/m.227406 type:complete len:286 (-) Transcript_73329:121-978(-)
MLPQVRDVHLTRRGQVNNAVPLVQPIVATILAPRCNPACRSKLCKTPCKELSIGLVLGCPVVPGPSARACKGLPVRREKSEEVRGVEGVAWAVALNGLEGHQGAKACCIPRLLRGGVDVEPAGCGRPSRCHARRVRVGKHQAGAVDGRVGDDLRVGLLQGPCGCTAGAPDAVGREHPFCETVTKGGAELRADKVAEAVLGPGPDVVARGEVNLLACHPHEQRCALCHGAPGVGSTVGGEVVCRHRLCAVHQQQRRVTEARRESGEGERCSVPVWRHGVNELCLVQ